jgi:hypothetical protein
MRWNRLCLAALVSVLSAVLCIAAERQPAAEERPPAQADRAELERQFAEKLSGSVLVGYYTVDGRNDDRPRQDRYEIETARKLRGDLWEITARIKYDQVDVKVPLTLPVLWAGDTPMISLSDVRIPLVGRGTFGARVLFHGDRYAGTWQHDEVGGHMWGRIERQENAK